MAEPAHAIVLPGGGYRVYGSRETEPIAEWLEALGLSANVFRYPLLARHPAPLEAVRAEIARVRAAGAERVGLVGFSAGGHLAAHAALAPGAADDERVDFVVAAYPVVSMQLRHTSITRDTLIGESPDDALRAETSADLLVTPDAPPFFIWHTGEDEPVPAQHSLMLAAALAAAGVRYELHIFSHGAHGLALAEGAPGVEAWPGLCASWLVREGFAG